MVKFKVLPNILSVNQKATVNVRKHFCPNKIHDVSCKKYKENLFVL